MKNLELLTRIERHYLRFGVLRAYFERMGMDYMIPVIWGQK